MKIIHYILVFILVSTLNLNSSAQNTITKKADKYYGDLQYAKAIKLYKSALEDTPGNIYLLKQLAYSNYKIGNYAEALRYYSQFISYPTADSNDWFQYAQLLKIDGNYSEAKVWFEKYLTNNPSDKLAKSQVEKLNQLNELVGSRNFIVRRINENTRFTDMCPVIYKDKFVFCSSRDTFSVRGNEYLYNGQPYLDIYSAGFHKRVIYEVQKFSKELNSPLHEGPVAFSPNGNTVYITRNSLNEKTQEGINNLKIFIYEWDGKRWINETEFPYNSNKYSVGHPAIANDGKTIYFVSNMPGGYGKTDIYKSELTTSGWSKPENLGPSVNTREKEMFPTLDSTRNIYFSSNGHLGFGGLDIFIAMNDSAQGYLVQNLGNTLNSSYDDFSLIYDESGEEGYFTSNRPYGEGSDDIYYFEIEKEIPNKRNSNFEE